MKTLNDKIAASAYLTSLVAKNKVEIPSSKADLLLALQECCDRIDLFDLEDSLGETNTFLIKLKQRFVLLWSVGALRGHLDQQALGVWQSQFADQTINFALSYGWQVVAAKHPALKTVLHDSKRVMPGLFIFCMGKLGGTDLNFSSDVDLVAYFDPKLLPVPSALGKSYICHQVLQQMSRLLSQNNGFDFIWRVDWRLRPNASATTLAMSTEAALQYYFYRASPWHRLALMKARVVAGDLALGDEFLTSLRPFLWRQNLDYRAIDELAEIKQRINLEHPSLRAERQWREPISPEISGFNVKLGSGGIREIEFIVNALQLIWGGKQPSLQTTNTLLALQALAKKGHLESELATQLANAYRLLREIENGIQMLENQHTHLLPNSEARQSKLCTLLGLSHWDELVERVNPQRRLVNEKFESLFADQTIDQQALHWPVGLSAAAQEVVESWARGFQLYGVSNQTKHRLRPLAHNLSEYLEQLQHRLGGTERESSKALSATVIRLHDYFRSLPRGEQYFRLLAESPRLLENIAMPLVHSPPMSRLLKQSPHIIDCYMQQEWRYPEDGFDAEYVLQAAHYEQRLELLRRFVNESLYQLYLRFLQGDMQPMEFKLALSDLAEFTLRLSLRLVSDNMKLDETPISILALGKMGLRRMSPTSDLDLVFIYDSEQTSTELASRYVSRLQTAISTPMREGIVYELDTRLRPSGRSGSPTLGVASFSQHQLNRAHTWEHIALAPGRVVAGPEDLNKQISQVKATVLSRDRDQQQMLKDAMKMWHRIAEHRVLDLPVETINNKLRKGGLMQAEYLASCLLIQSAAPQAESDFDELLRAELADTEYRQLPDIIEFWRVQQLWERLLGKTGQPLDSIDPLYLQRLFKQSGVESLAQLMDKKIAYAEQVTRFNQAMFNQIEDTEFDHHSWLETSVQWVNQ